jgi:FixJ family two-component response regulator
MSVNRDKIGVIDDDPSVRRALRRLLKSYGYAPSVYTCPRDFLDHIDDAPHFRCLIIDLCMPGMSGFELQEELKRRGVQTPFIFITGEDDEKKRERARRAGATGFCSKPFEEAALITAIESAAA